MSIFRNGFTALRAGVLPGPADDFWYTPAGFGSQSAGGQKVDAHSAMRLSTVFACVNIICRSMGSMPFKLYRQLPGGGKEVADQHPLYDVLYSRPNPWQTAYEFRQMMQAHFELRGNAYAQIIPGPRGFADQLVPLHPDYMLVKRLPDGSPQYIYRDPFTGENQVFFQEDIFHLRNLPLDSFHGLVGSSTISIAAETMGMGLAAQDYGARFFANDAKPPAVITGLNFKHKEDEEKFRESWQRSQTGANRHKTAILPLGSDIKELGIKNTDAQFLELRKYNRSEIGSIFGVPSHMLGETEKTATYASVEQFAIMYATQCILPRAVAWEQATSRDLLLDSGTFFPRFSMAALLRADLINRYTAYEKGRNGGWLSVNDIRELEDMNPVPNGDGYLQPLNMAPLGTEPAEPADPQDPTPNPAPKPGPNQEDKQPDDTNRAHADPRLKLLAAAAASRCIRKEVAALRKDVASANGEFPEKLAAFYAEHRRFVGEVLAIDDVRAGHYCRSHQQALLQAKESGTVERLLARWEFEASDELTAIAVGGEA